MTRNKIPCFWKAEEKRKISFLVVSNCVAAARDLSLFIMLFCVDHLKASLLILLSKWQKLFLPYFLCVMHAPISRSCFFFHERCMLAAGKCSTF